MLCKKGDWTCGREEEKAEWVNHINFIDFQSFKMLLGKMSAYLG